MWQQNADETKDKCERLRESAGIEVGVDWGFASSSEKRRWKDYMCDCHYTAGWSDSCLQGKPPTVHSTTTAAGIAQAVAAREPREKLSRRPGKHAYYAWMCADDVCHFLCCLLHECLGIQPPRITP